MSRRRVVVGADERGRPISRWEDAEAIDQTPRGGIAVGSPEAAAAIARVGEGKALGSADHMQKSRLNGARRHVEVVTAKPALRPPPPPPPAERPERPARPPVDREVASPAPEDPVMSSDAYPLGVAQAIADAELDAAEAREGFHTVKPPPAPPVQLPQVRKPPAMALADVAQAALEAARAEQAAQDARVASLVADLALDRAIAQLMAAWGDSGLADQAPRAEPVIPSGQLIDAGEAAVAAATELEAAEEDLARLVVDEAIASVALDRDPLTQTQSMPEPAARPAVGLTPRQTKVLELMRRHDGDRSSVARLLGVKYQTVDGLLEAMARKGLLPVTEPWVAKLPTRFARWIRVPA